MNDVSLSLSCARKRYSPTEQSAISFQNDKNLVLHWNHHNAALLLLPSTDDDVVGWSSRFFAAKSFNWLAVAWVFDKKENAGIAVALKFIHKLSCHLN